MSLIITIGRQYGSGGRELGEKLAAELGFEFYDEELVTLAAEKQNMHKDILREADEKATKSLLYTLVTGGDMRYLHSPVQYEMPINDKLFITQSEIIKRLAAKGNCVIVGRCADYVLRDIPEQCIHLFIYADLEKRISRISKKYDISPEKAKDKIRKIEKARSTYYNYYSNREWGKCSNYDMLIDAGKIGIDNAVRVVKALADIRRNGD